MKKMSKFRMSMYLFLGYLIWRSEWIPFKLKKFLRIDELQFKHSVGTIENYLIKGFTFSRKSFRSLVFKNCEFEDCEFEDCFFYKIDFDSVNMKLVLFRDCRFSEVYFNQVNLFDKVLLIDNAFAHCNIDEFTRNSITKDNIFEPTFAEKKISKREMEKFKNKMKKSIAAKKIL